MIARLFLGILTRAPSQGYITKTLKTVDFTEPYYSHYMSRYKNGIALKRASRYVNSTRDYGILFDGNKSLIKEGLSNADWAGCRNSRKSTSEFVFLVGAGAVSWRSKKQACVSTSACDAEYIAMCLATENSI